MLPRIPGFPESWVWPQITLCPMRSKCVSFMCCACPYPCSYWDTDSGEAILGHKDQSHTPDGRATTSESFTGQSWAAIPIWDFQLRERKFYVFKPLLLRYPLPLCQMYALTNTGCLKANASGKHWWQTEESLVFFNLLFMLLFDPASSSRVLNAGITTPYPQKNPKSPFYYLSGRSVF